MMPAKLPKVSKKRCKSILVVEDEPTIRENLKTLLELEGYNVYTANNGEDGLRILRTMPHPCLILLDLLMPVMSGVEFLSAMSQNDAMAAIPVCVISGVSEKPSMPNIAAFVRKPIEFDGLLRFIRNYCGAPMKNREK